MKKTPEKMSYKYPESDTVPVVLYYVLADSNTETIDDDENDIPW